METLKTIARIQSAFPEKFGIPRQSGLVDGLRATVVFEPEYRRPEALQGLADFSHIWLVWGFSQAERASWSPTVRPPRLGGNARMGVFATRSPYRPNAIGLSSVRLDHIEQHPMLGPVLHVLGADLLDGTPIYDIKPYLPYTDCHPDAVGGFTDEVGFATLQVRMDGDIACILPEGVADTLCSLLAQDPRPSYQQDPDRVYGMAYGGFEVKFSVSGDALTVLDIRKK